MATPRTTKKWVVDGQNGFESLKLIENQNIPRVGDKEVLVRIQGVSINFRDILITQGRYPLGSMPSIVPGSDGAGTIVAVGSHVTRFKEGDKVITLFNQGHIGGTLDQYSVKTGLGGSIDGTLQQYGAFDENGLVHMPSSLNFVEASTLTCAGLTAWNALFGLKKLSPGDWVLTQGTGGVSMFALQFAKAAGATVVSTTSSEQKAKILKELGADHIVNYKTYKDWGERARLLTPNNRGFDHILEVGGPHSIGQSFNAIKIDGTITMIGFLGGDHRTPDEPSFMQPLAKMCTVRGLLVGSREQMEEMCRAVEANNIKPIVDDNVFAFEKAREAYEYMFAQKQFGKVCIRIE